MKTKFAMCLSYLALVMLATGCKSLFPAEGSQAKSTLTSFDDAQAAFDKIKLRETTVAELKQLGFDLQTTPNVKVLTYLDIMERFLPNQSITKDDLPKDVRDCIESKDCCHAYELLLDVSDSKRYGNLCLDVLGFKKRTHITGWNFKALLIIKDEVVSYKLRSGQPMVDRLDRKLKPLGPFQDMEGVVAKMPGMF